MNTESDVKKLSDVDSESVQEFLCEHCIIVVVIFTVIGFLAGRKSVKGAA